MLPESHHPVYWYTGHDWILAFFMNTIQFYLLFYCFHNLNMWPPVEDEQFMVGWPGQSGWVSSCSSSSSSRSVCLCLSRLVQQCHQPTQPDPRLAARAEGGRFHWPVWGWWVGLPVEGLPGLNPGTGLSVCSVLCCGFNIDVISACKCEAPLFQCVKDWSESVRTTWFKIAVSLTMNNREQVCANVYKTEKLMLFYIHCISHFRFLVLLRVFLRLIL